VLLLGIRTSFCVYSELFLNIRNRVFGLFGYLDFFVLGLRVVGYWEWELLGVVGY
jgi:hypothetical protein